MSTRQAIKDLFAAMGIWNIIVNAGDPEPAVAPESKIFLNESPKDLPPPFIVYTYSQMSQTGSQGDGTIGVTSGSILAIFQFGIPTGVTINAQAEVIQGYLEAMRDEMQQLSATGTHLLIRDIAWSNPAKSDDEFVDANGNQFWQAELNAEYGLTL